MQRTMLVCVGLALAPGLAAQTTGRVLPSSAASKDPSYWDSLTFSGINHATLKNESHVQHAFDSADVGGAAVWKTLHLRRPKRLSNSNAATSFSSTVIMSNSPVAHTQLSATFTQNHGTGTGVGTGTAPQTVFSGTLSLPANSFSATQPWPHPWFLAVTFKTAFVHAPVKGGSLVVEYINTKNSNMRTYYVEGHQPDRGTRVSNGTFGGCWYHSDGGYNSGLSHINPTVGGSWLVWHKNMPSNEPNMNKSLLIVGLQGVGGTYAGKKLPIKITDLGFLDICKYMQPGQSTIFQPGLLYNDLAISPLIVPMPMLYVPNTTGAKSLGSVRGPTINIPNVPSLAGKSFFSQSFSLDKKLGNFDQVYMGWSSKWTVGSGKGPPASMVYRRFNNSSTTGSFQPWTGQTCMLK